MKKITAALAVVVLGAGLTVAAIAAPASAETSSSPVTATCSALTVELDGYTVKPEVPAVTEERLVTPAVEYQPAVYGEPPLLEEAVEYQPAVYATEYEYRHAILIWKTRWEAEGWNSDGHESFGWYSTGNTRQGALVSAEVPASDAVYGEPPLVSAEVPAQDAVYETVVITPAIPGDETPNWVSVELDGEVLLAPEHGLFDTFINVGPISYNPYVAHDYTVTVSGWDRELEVISGTTVPCDEPIVPANPAGTIETECGVATLELTNVEAEYEDNLTASAVLYIDGEFAMAYSIAGDEVVTDEVTFDEDSGAVELELRTGPAHGDELLAEATVDTDCEAEVVPPVKEEPKPVVEAKPAAAPAAPAALAADETILAETGFDAAPLAWMAAAGLIAGLALIGGVTYVASRAERK